MTLTRLATLSFCLGALFHLVWGPSPAAAETYPSKPIRLVIPWPSGSGGDIAGRLIAQKLSEILGQNVYVDNRGGATGTIGTQAARREPADGYTLILGNSATHGSAKVLFPNVTYDPVRDFTPISLIYRNLLAIAVKRELPVETLPQFVTYAKAHPRQLSFGTPGVATPHQLAGEILNQKAGIELLHVPYQGGGRAMNDLVGGHIPVVVGAVSTAVEHHKAGQIKILAVTEPQRLPFLPDVPAVAEYYSPFDFSGWGGILGPGNLPESVVVRLNEAIRTALASEDLRKTLDAGGFTPQASSPQELRERIESETGRWEAVVKSGVKITN